MSKLFIKSVLRLRYKTQEFHTFLYESVGEDKVEKLTLCVCSSDIKIGDAVIELVGTPNERKFIVLHIYEDKDMDGNNITMIGDDEEAINSQNVIKVIGEVSSEAKWVKEGMEFEEDEIQIRKICHDASTPPWDSYCFHCSRSRGCDNDEGDEVLIKGPCGHFH